MKGVCTVMVAAASAGLALLGGALGERFPAPARPGPVAVWVADRDGHEVAGLDQDLFVALRVPVRYPIDVESRADGGLWLVSAPEGNPLTPHRLGRLDRSGCLRAEASLGTFLDLATLDGGDALVVDRDGSGRTRLRRVDADGGATQIAPTTGARCVAGADGRVLVGTDNGWLLLFDLAQPQLGAVQRRWCGGTVSDVAVGPSGGWWILTTGGPGGGRVLRTDAELRAVWEAPSGLQAVRLAPVPDDERVWLVDTRGPRARLLGARGRVDVPAAALAHAGLERAAATPDGGLVLVSPGAVLRLDARGARQPGQGGFAFLVDVTRGLAPSRSRP